MRNKSQSGLQRGFDNFEIETPLRVEEVGTIRIRHVDGSINEADFSGLSLDELPVVRGDMRIEEVFDLALGFLFRGLIKMEPFMKLSSEMAFYASDYFCRTCFSIAVEAALGQNNAG